VTPDAIPDQPRRRALRVIAIAMVAGGSIAIWRELGPATVWPPHLDALAGAALILFGGTLASVNLRWTLSARRAGERAPLALFVDAFSTGAGLPALALLAWSAAR